MGFSDLLTAVDRAVLQHLGGAVVRYAPSAVAGDPFVEVQGMFDAQYVHVDAAGAAVSGVGPAVFLRRADLGAFDPDTDEDPTVTVNGTLYRVREAKPDSLGGVVLLLQDRP